MAIMRGNNVTVKFRDVDVSNFNCNVPTKFISTNILEPVLLGGTGADMTTAEKRKFDDFINELESK
jgi:hypothetical protein|tara:strand:- start:3 stop:200 length:198 start_codon:yes stop_codon:yes gene_type:complete